MNDMLRKRTWTSVEESKRLVGSGLPEATADLYYTWYHLKDDWCDLPEVLEQPFASERDAYPQIDILPCWSGLRLAELIVENTGLELRIYAGRKELTVSNLVSAITDGTCGKPENWKL